MNNGLGGFRTGKDQRSKIAIPEEQILCLSQPVISEYHLLINLNAQSAVL